MANDTFLNAFGMGSSLADRARNYQLQLADLALKQQEAGINQQKSALAMQAQGYALQHQKEQDAYLAEDLPKVQEWQKQYLQWNAQGDPTAPFPEPPSDLKSLTALKTVGDMSQQVLQSLPMAQNRYFTHQAVHQTLGQINDDVKFALDHGMGDVVLQNNSGLSDNGRPDITRWKAIQQAIAPERKKQQELKDVATISQVGGRIYIDELNDQLASGEITQERYNQLKPYARTKGGVGGQIADQQIGILKQQGVVKTPEDEAAAKQYLLGPSRGKLDTDVKKSFEVASSAVSQLSEVENKVKEFEKNHGPGSFAEYIGPIDAPKFNLTGRLKGLNTDEQKEAKAVLQQIQLVVDRYQKGMYGSALTANEIKKLDSLVGSPSRNDYLTLIEGFKSGLTSGLKNVVEDHRYSPEIQADVKKRYAPGIFGGSGNKVGRFTIQVE